MAILVLPAEIRHRILLYILHDAYFGRNYASVCPANASAPNPGEWMSWEGFRQHCPALFSLAQLKLVCRCFYEDVSYLQYIWFDEMIVDLLYETEDPCQGRSTGCKPYPSGLSWVDTILYRGDWRIWNRTDPASTVTLIGDGSAWMGYLYVCQLDIAGIHVFREKLNRTRKDPAIRKTLQNYWYSADVCALRHIKRAETGAKGSLGLLKAAQILTITVRGYPPADHEKAVEAIQNRIQDWEKWAKLPLEIDTTWSRPYAARTTKRKQEPPAWSITRDAGPPQEDSL